MDAKKIYAEALKQYNAKNYDAALKFLGDVEKFAPNFKDAYYLEYRIHNATGNFVKECSALEKLLPLLDFTSPAEKEFAAEVLINMADACGQLGLSAEAVEFCLSAEKITDNVQKKYNVINAAIFHMNYLENRSPENFHALYDVNKKFFASIEPYTKKFYNHKKIRVGFLSTDFYFHPVINWSWSLLTRLDKNFFQTYFYSAVQKSDVVTDYLRSTADGWRDIFSLTDEAVAKLIRADEIDILFEMNGHAGYNRLRVAAYRPASVQMSGIGYMNSTGLDCIDYFLSDVYCAGDEKFFTEKIIKLPHSHICYEPPIYFEPANAPPCLKNNFVTFGCFNNFCKVKDSILIAWKKILDAVPNSRLILKNVIFNTDDGKNFVGECLKNFGFDLARIDMRPFSANHLAEYADVDIALDTFPYTGGVTTCEALYMGVPVVSLYGSRHGPRFGLSILKNVGLDELAVASYDDYIKRTIELANDWELLAILRKNLRTMMKKSPLMNSENYLREIQSAFIKILDDEEKKFPL
ncbi:MAG: hypothetical protein IJQ85_01815 [Selenomonadaceae bacterium]|nr:hypothetical protein [Selenomonadaceae bacterium]